MISTSEIIVAYLKSIWILISLFMDTAIYKLFGQRTIDDEENIDGKVVVVTGASRGIGKGSALEFAKRGATVVLGCVDLKEGAEALEDIKRQTGNNHLVMIYLDLSDMDEVEKFATTVNNLFPEIHILLNNAGLAGSPNVNVKTKDGFNMHVAVNHLGHFLLTNLLLKNLKKGGSARVISISSTMQLLSILDLDDLMMYKSGLGHRDLLPYANTKYCNALFINELGRRLGGTGVTTYGLCPGPVTTTIYGKLRWPEGYLMKRAADIFGFDIPQACEGIMYCALSKSIAKETGRMYRFKKHFNHAQRRLSQDLAKDLWDLSARLVKLEQRLLQ